MWKKIGVTLIALLSTFSVVYAMNREMSAASLSYIPLVEGDKIYIGNYEGQNVVWDVARVDTTGDRYILATSNVIGTAQMCDDNSDGLTAKDIINGGYIRSCSYKSATSGKTDSGLYTKITDFNGKSFNNFEKTILSSIDNNKGEPSFTPSATDINLVSLNPNATLGFTKADQFTLLGKTYYLHGKITQKYGTLSPNLGNVYHATVSSSGGTTDNAHTDSEIGFITPSKSNGAHYVVSNIFRSWAMAGNVYTTSNVRPFTLLPIGKTVFAIDETIKGDVLTKTPPSTTKQGDGLVIGARKLRVLDPSLSVTLENQTIGTLPQKTIISLSYSGASTGTNQYISALITDSEGKLAYYQKLELAKSGSENKVSIDTTNIDIDDDYNIYLVNEVISNDVRPTISSPLSNSLSFNVSGNISSLDYSETPQKDTLGNPMIYLQFAENAQNDMQVATAIAKIKDGSNFIMAPYNVNYEIISASGSTTPAFIFKLDGDGKAILDSSGNAIIYAKQDIVPGAYKFRIRAYDDSNNPQSANGYGVDKTGAEIVGTNPGLISDEQIIVVYPNHNQLIYEQKKNPTSTVLYTKDELNALSTGSVLATSTFSDGTLLDSSGKAIDDANIDVLQAEGYNIKEIRLVKPGTTTLLNELEAKPVFGNLNKFEIKKKSGASFTSDINFDILVVFENGGSETAIIRKSNQVFEIPSGLKFVNPEDSKFLSTNAYEFTWNSNANNQFIIMATDNTSPTTINNKVTYCILDASKVCATSSTVLSFISGGSAGTQKVQVNAPGSTDKKVTVRSMTKNTSNEVLTYSDIELTIHPAKQVLSWVGSDIQETGNHITKKTPISVANAQTWELNLKYDSVDKTKNIIDLHEIFASETLTSEAMNVLSNIIKTDTPAMSITYQLIGSSADTAKLKLDSSTGKLEILGELSGDVSIKAIGNATGNYTKTVESDDPSTTTVNEIGFATLILHISSKPDIDFTFDSGFVGGKTTATSTYAKGTKDFGTLSLNPTGATISNYEIKKVEVEKSDGTWEDKTSSLMFTLTGTLKDSLKASFQLEIGTYRITVVAKDSSTEVSLEKSIDIQIENETFDYTKLKWQSKDRLPLGSTFVNVSGTLSEDATTNEYIQNATLKKTYEKDGYFNVQVIDTDSTTLSGTSITYSLSSDSTLGIIDVEASGKVNLLHASTTGSKLKVKATIKKVGYKDLEVFIPIEIEKGISDFKFVDKFGVAYTIPTLPSNVSDPYVYSPLLDPDSTKTPKEPYSFVKDKKLDVITAEAPANTKVTISIVDKGTSMGNDVLKFNDLDSYLVTNVDTATKVCEISASDYASNRTSACLVQIQHALNLYKGADLNKINIVAEILESDDYKAKRLEMPVNILPSVQTDFDFLDAQIPLDSTTSFTGVTPVFKPATANSSTGLIELMVEDPDSGVMADSTIIRLGSSSGNLAYDGGIDSIEYKLLVPKDGPDNDKTLIIYAIKQKDRDHYESELKRQEWIIAKEGTSRLKINVSSYEDASDPAFKKYITYGDAYFKIDASTPTDEDDPANPPTYTYTIDPSSSDYMEVYGSTGNTFRPLKAGNATQIFVNVTRKQSGQSDITKKVPITIAPRPIKLKVEDITKKSGMLVETKEYAFTSTSDTFLASDLADIDIAFSCQDTSAKDVTTLVDGIRKVHDKLPIKASITNKDVNKDVLSNYIITSLDESTNGAEDGKLIVTESESDASWYEVKEGSYLDELGTSIPTIKGLNDWYNGPVDVILKKVTGSYDLIAPEDKADQWASDKFTVTTQGNTTQNVFFRMSSGDDEGSITKPQEESIKIDMVAPEITEIKATLTHTDAFSKLIHAITFGTFMKPGEEVTISTKDVQANTEIEVSTTNSIPDAITYNVYTLDINGVRDEQIITDEKLDTNDEGVATFSLDDPGVYEVCATVMDQATNTSEEKCEKLLVKKINFDGDGDKIPDYLDPDGDGCPDIDIVLTDKKGDLYKINVDRDKDNIPDLNIDSDGDGIAEINVDTDEDDKPDLNLVILDKWEPTFCVTDQSSEYCTMKDIEPIINVDTGTDTAGSPPDGIPDINIDNKGDMKPHINISIDGKTASLNILKLHKWEPKVDYTKDKFLYDSLGVDTKALTNIDSDDDGRADINIDFNDDGVPDLNIDGDGNGIPEVNIDGDGDGNPDFNLDPDENGKPTKNVIKITEWNPDKDGEKDKKEFDTMEIKSKEELEDNEVKVEKPGGSFLPNYSIKVSDVSETIEDTIKEEIGKLAKDQEIKTVYDVSLWKDDVITQPDGVLRVKLPYDESIKNPKIIMELADGSFKEIDAIIEDGYLVYETDYLGKVSITGDKVSEEEPQPDEEPKPDEEPNDKPDVTIPDHTGGSTPDTSVKGNYTSAMGGAGTGDATQIDGYLYVICMAMGSVLILLHHKSKQS